ncbi:ankyrin repeat-containing domain protein [Aspergillus alliaceus]|uniref:Ankyrin repeat-containing domain protein n=1 Tax=Petromyces alliaceus TaxID=209559 RepID=A0A5N7BW86_PETAA|nr:ankyrin repeat-containing domain protein [Aspergillus alliaceus]
MDHIPYPTFDRYEEDEGDDEMEIESDSESIRESNALYKMDKLLERGVDDNGKHFGIQDALSWAAELNNLNAIRQLVDEGADVTWRKRPGSWTALHYAAGGWRRSSAIQILVDRGADVATTAEPYGRTPLHIAALMSTVDHVGILLRNGAEVNARSSLGETALILAAYSGRRETVQLLLNSGADINAKANDGRTALGQACTEEDKPEVVRLLLKAGADVHARDNQGCTSLGLAAKGRASIQVMEQIEHAQYLLRVAPSTLVIADKHGQTPLALAATTPLSGSRDMVLYLLKQGSSLGNPGLEVKDNDGNTLLALSAAGGRDEVIETLLDMRANIKATNNSGKSPLSLAAENGHAKAVELLVEGGGDLESKDKNGNTPLALAAMNGHVTVVELLLDAGANIDLADRNERSVWGLAKAHGQDRVVHLLSEERRKQLLLIQAESIRTSSPSSHLTYIPLPGTRSTRILVLQPGQFHDEIHCSLELINFKSYHSRYEALSYVWGTDSPSEEIRISGQRVFVRRNLFWGLRHLRHRETPRVLWVDAICIDQDNMPERNLQVQNMTAIYSRASCVLIWLGLNNELGPTFSIMQQLNKEMEEIIESGDVQDYVRWNPKIADFLENVYFERAWIYQEVVSASSATIYSGTSETDIKITYSIPWDTLSRYYNFLGERRMGQYDRLGSFTSRVGPLVRGRSAYLISRSTGLDLLSLLESRRDCQSSVPVDKVYAVLGLSTEGQSGRLFADYSLSETEVLTNVARFVIESRKDLRILSAVQHFNPNSDIPSWAPDWRRPWVAPPIIYRTSTRSDPRNIAGAGSFLRRRVQLLDFTNDISYGPIENNQRDFQAAGGKPLSMSFVGKPTELRLKGVHISEIKAILNLDTDILGCATNPAHISNLLGVRWWSSYFGPNETYLEAICKTMVADLDEENEEGLDVPFPQGSGFDRLIQLARIRSRFQGASTARKLIMTENGYVGLGPASTVPGDEICVLFGGNVPYIVRGSREYKRFIGECYCHGLMNGEALKNHPVDENLYCLY